MDVPTGLEDGSGDGVMPWPIPALYVTTAAQMAYQEPPRWLVVDPAGVKTEIASSSSGQAVLTAASRTGRSGAYRVTDGRIHQQVYDCHEDAIGWCAKERYE